MSETVWQLKSAISHQDRLSKIGEWVIEEILVKRLFDATVKFSNIFT